MTNNNQQKSIINKESATLQDQLDRSNRLKISCPVSYHIGYEHLLAGISGGVTSTMILHPLDTLKTRLAVSNRKLSRLRPHYNGLLDAFSTIRRTEGLRGLYRGVSLNIFSAGCAWGSYFFFYDLIKVNFQDCDPTRQLGPARHMLAASEAGIITLILTNPIWVVKTRLCLQFGENLQQLSENKRYKNMTDALFKTYQYEGLKGLYKGFIPGLFGVSHGALQFMTYEEMKNAYNVYWNQSIDTSLNTVTYLSFAAASKLFAATATYPYQVMRTRMQDQFQDYKGFLDVFNQTWRYEGFRGFYKGLVPSLLRVTPATAITFVVYEKVSHSLIEAQQSSTSSAIVQHHPTVRDSAPILTDVPVIRIHGPSS